MDQIIPRLRGRVRSQIVLQHSEQLEKNSDLCYSQHEPFETDWSVSFRFQQNRKLDDVELEVGAGDGVVSAPPVEATDSTPFESAPDYKSSLRHTYFVTATQMIGLGAAFIAIGAFLNSVLFGTLLLSIWFGGMFILGGISLYLGGMSCNRILALQNRMRNFHSNRKLYAIVSYGIAGLPWVMLVLLSTLFPGYLTQVMRAPYPLVIGTVLNLVGLYLMLRAKNRFTWYMPYLFLALPALFFIPFGPLLIILREAEFLARWLTFCIDFWSGTPNSLDSPVIV